MTRRAAKTEDPLDIPEFLLVTPADAARRKQWWIDHPPQAASFVPEQTSEARARREELRRLESLERIAAMKARRASREFDNRFLRRAPSVMTQARYDRIMRELPTASARKLFKEQYPVGTPIVPRVIRISDDKPQAVERVSRRADTVLSERIGEYLARGDFKTRLIALAGVNDVWDPRYSDLDKGRMRMTVSNRLRGLVKKGIEIRWPK